MHRHRDASETGDARTRQRPFRCQRDGQDDHQGLVRHRVNHTSGDRLQLPFPCDPPVDEIGDARVGKEGECPFEVIVHQQIRGHGRGHQA